MCAGWIIFIANSKHKLLKQILLLFAICFLSSCGQKDHVNLYELEPFDQQGNIQVVIEIPAGTNKKIEIDPISGRFVVDQRDGKDRVIDFLPYPANYGFIPGTLSDPTAGGDGDALDVFVLAEHLPTGKVIDVIPVSMVQMLDDGEHDNKILAVPVDPSLRIIQATKLVELRTNYPTLLPAMENWLMSYDPVDPIVIQGWVNEQLVRSTIEASIKK